MTMKALPLLALCLLAGCDQQPPRPEFTGRIRIDAGTEYVLTDVPSPIGGQCVGWSAVSVQKPGDSTSGQTNLMCWRRDGDKIEVNTEQGIGRRKDPAYLFSD